MREEAPGLKTGFSYHPLLHTTYNLLLIFALCLLPFAFLMPRRSGERGAPQASKPVSPIFDNNVICIIFDKICQNSYCQSYVKFWRRNTETQE